MSKKWKFLPFSFLGSRPFSSLGIGTRSVSSLPKSKKLSYLSSLPSFPRWSLIVRPSLFYLRPLSFLAFSVNVPFLIDRRRGRRGTAKLPPTKTAWAERDIGRKERKWRKQIHGRGKTPNHITISQLFPPISPTRRNGLPSYQTHWFYKLTALIVRKRRAVWTMMRRRRRRRLG